jgi:hypothetical protein
MFTIHTGDWVYRATAQSDDTFYGIDKVWKMELTLDENDKELGWSYFDHYFTADVFDLIREKLAPIA